MKRMIASLAFLTLACTVSPAQDATVGTWTGVGFQKMANGSISQWTIRMRIESRDKATIEYPSLNCGGTLTYLRDIGPIREYREQLTYGAERCVDNGTVGFHPKMGKLVWYWAGEGTKNPTNVDIAVLVRADK